MAHCVENHKLKKLSSKIYCSNPKKWLVSCEINTCHQFHQHYMRAFFVRKFVQSQNVSRKSCRNNVHTKNSYVKKLMKLTPGHRKVSGWGQNGPHEQNLASPAFLGSKSNLKMPQKCKRFDSTFLTRNFYRLTN